MRLIHKAYAAAVVPVLACFAIADAQAQTATQVPPPPYPLPTVKPPAAPPIQYPFYLDGSFAAQWRQPASDPAGTTTFDPGFMASVAAGARFGAFGFGAFRVEGEYNHFNNTNDTLLVTALPPPYNRPLPALGNIDVNTFFLNAAYDFDLSRFGLGWPVKPFLSAGYGGLQSDIHSLANNVTVVNGAFIVNSTSDWIPVWQVKVGAAIPITDRLDLFADYRYVRGVNHLNFIINGGATVNPEIAFNVLELGARINF
jgi:opacity protein-like surface antigen